MKQIPGFRRMVAAFLLSWEVPSLKLYLWLSLTPIILPSQSSMCHVRWQSWCFSCRLVKPFDFTYPGNRSDRYGEGEGKTMEECGKMALCMMFQLVYPCLKPSWLGQDGQSFLTQLSSVFLDCCVGWWFELLVWNFRDAPGESLPNQG